MDQIAELKEQVDLIMEEEQEALDNMPESFQEGEKGERAQAAIEALENASSAFEEVDQYLNEAIE